MSLGKRPDLEPAVGKTCFLTNNYPSFSMKIPESTFKVYKIRSRHTLNDGHWFVVELDHPPNSTIPKMIEYGHLVAGKLNKLKWFTRQAFEHLENDTFVFKVVKTELGFELKELEKNFEHNKLCATIQLPMHLALPTSEGEFCGGELIACDAPKRANGIKDLESHILSPAESKELNLKRATCRKTNDTNGLKAILNRISCSAIAYLACVHGYIPDFPDLKRIICATFEDEEEIKVMGEMASQLRKRLDHTAELLRTKICLDPKIDTADLGWPIRQHQIKALETQVKSGEIFLKRTLRIPDEPESGIALFWTNGKIESYRNSVQELFIDGGFFSVPTKKTQLVVLMAKKENRPAVPLIYGLTRSRKASIYSVFLSTAKELLNFDNKVSIHCDFERALLISATSHGTVRPCYFHATQIFFKNKLKLEQLAHYFANAAFGSNKRLSISSAVRNLINVPEERKKEMKAEFLVTVSSSLANMAKFCLFIDTRFLSQAFLILKKYCANWLDEVFLEATKQFFDRHSTYLPINPNFNTTNNYAESFFSDIKRRMRPRPTFSSLLTELIFSDRKSQEGYPGLPTTNQKDPILEIQRWFFCYDGCHDQLEAKFRELSQLQSSLETAGLTTMESDPRKLRSTGTINRRNLVRIMPAH
jgi:hypothetical protein